MAINDKLLGVEVVITVGDQPVKEYVDYTEAEKGPDAEKTVVKYIESVSDTYFMIRNTVLPDYSKDHALVFYFHLDGGKDDAPRPNIYRHEKPLPYATTSPGWGGGVLGEDKTIIILFKFLDVEIVHDTEKVQIEKDKIASNDLGEIVICVHHVKVLSIVPKGDAAKGIMKAGVIGSFALSEKAMKVRNVTRRIARGGLGDGFSEPLNEHVKADYLDGLKNPLATYKFGYRSKAALKAAFILDDFEDLSPEEPRRRARELARSERRLAQQVDIKPEPKIKNKRGTKRERDEHDDGEPIDLTDDGPPAAKRAMATIDLTDD